MKLVVLPPPMVTLTGKRFYSSRSTREASLAGLSLQLARLAEWNIN
jgi:hypothetical protein